MEMRPESQVKLHKIIVSRKQKDLAKSELPENVKDEEEKM